MSAVWRKRRSQSGGPFCLRNTCLFVCSPLGGEYAPLFFIKSIKKLRSLHRCRALLPSQAIEFGKKTILLAMSCFLVPHRKRHPLCVISEEKTRRLAAERSGAERCPAPSSSQVSPCFPASVLPSSHCGSAKRRPSNYHCPSCAIAG